MQSSRGSEVPELASQLSRSRSRSCSTTLSSDSQLSRVRFVTPPPVNPPPSFIAPAAASQIITADQEFNAADFLGDDDEEDDSTASALVTTEALTALNGFLDHLLFNILGAAKSTQLSSIRPAIADVLKPRLAKEVVSVADEELSEYLGGPEDERIEFRGPQAQTSDFDLIRSWKLTRLRCMVYTRLGDMEEDDEEEYITQEGLGDDEDTPRRFNSNVGNITPAAAIFLTSIIEHLGEQALVIAGETARSRLSAKPVDESGENLEPAQARGSMNRLIVEDLDMEKLALNPTLGRLWRTWRKRTRTPNLSRMASRESIIRRRGTIGPIPHSRKSSVSLGDEFLSQSTSSPPPVDRKTDVDPACIPLPISENDILEIENPGFTSDGEGSEAQTMEAVVAHKVRPRSLMVLSLPSPKSPGSNAGSPLTPKARSASGSRHGRSHSLPSPSSSFEEPAVEQPILDRVTPSSEERNRLETMYEHDEEEVTENDPDEQNIESLVAQDEPSPRLSQDLPPADKPETDGQLAETAGTGVSHETPAQLSSPTAPLEAATSSRSSTTTVSSTILIDRDPEVIEGQGMCEKPDLTSVQRPKRKPSQDITGTAERSAHLAPVEIERVAETVVEDPQHTRTEDISTSIQPITDQDEGKDSSTILPIPETLAQEVTPSIDDAVEPEPRPVSTSGESARSDLSRTYSKPSPLTLASGSHHRQGVSVSSPVTERAAVQRISGRPTASVASSNYSKSNRSDSFNSHREKRPVTAGSATSQVSNKLKGLITRPNDSAPLRLRSSSETSRVSGNTGESFYDDTSGLDELIRSEETIHYTLTPKSVREMDFPDSPVRRTPRSTTAELADFLKNTGPDDAAWPGRISTTSSRGATDSHQGSGPRSPGSPKHSPIHLARMASQQRSKIGQPRDARPSLESSSDFAQFIKNSGPDVPSSPASGPNHLAKSTPRRFSDATEISKNTSRAESVVSSSTRNTPLQARPAMVPKAELTSDLIDFIREGPPTIGAHRIPRTVAPFRSTMDSDDMAFEDGRTNLGTPSVTSTQDELTTTKSQVSLGSRTGLLESPNRVNIQSSSTKVSSNTSRNINEFGEPRPQRKQRRVRDPYAIDFDDDDDFEELFQEPLKPQREEESLIDFLRNAPPPTTESQPQPFVLSNPPTKSTTSGFGSASAMKARLLRNTSFERAPPSKPSRTSLRQSEQYSNGNSNYTVKVGMERHRGTMNSLPSVSERRQTETSALADFLRNTGPPEPPSRPPVATKEPSFSRRLFVRRKKVEA